MVPQGFVVSVAQNLDVCFLLSGQRDMVGRGHSTDASANIGAWLKGLGFSLARSPASALWVIRGCAVGDRVH